MFIKFVVGWLVCSAWLAVVCLVLFRGLCFVCLCVCLCCVLGGIVCFVAALFDQWLFALDCWWFVIVCCVRCWFVVVSVSVVWLVVVHCVFVWLVIVWLAFVFGLLLIGSCLLCSACSLYCVLFIL